MSHHLPEATRRLFSHYRDRERIDSTAPELVIGRVLEEGDTDDLRWLTSRYTEPRIGEWFSQHGQRQLTRRSLAFWRIVLNRSPHASDTREDLWPL